MNPAEQLLYEIELIRVREHLSQTAVARRLKMQQSAWAAVRNRGRVMPLTAAERAKQLWPELTTPVLRYYEHRAQTRVAAAARSTGNADRSDTTY